MAVLPTPTVTGQVSITSNPNFTLTNDSAPSIAVDPTNPQRLAAVWTDYDAAIAVPEPQITVHGATSTDGGQTWTTFSMPFARTDPSSSATNPVPFAEITDGNVAFDRNHNFYVVTVEHNAANSAGVIMLDKFSFAGAAPTMTIKNESIYAWSQAAAVRPTLAVDTNLASFTDTDANGVTRTQTDPTAGNVYVAWATIDPNIFNVPAPFFNANTIKMVASSNGGTSFSGMTTVNEGGPSGNDGIERDTAPRLTISQGRAPGTNGAGDTGVPGGQVSLVWDDFGSGATAFNPPLDLITVNQVNQAANTAGQTFAATPGGINPAVTGAGGTVPGVTTFNVPVKITDPKFVSVSDLDVRLAVTAPAVGDLTVNLISPGGQSIALVPNGGASGSALGIGTGFDIYGATFDSEALIPLAKGSAPFIGNYQPAGDLSSFNGKDPTGTWKLQIIDTDTNGGGAVRLGSLIFTSGLQVNTAQQQTAALTSVRGALQAPYTTATTADPFGIGPAPALASDNTLGQYSPHQGRIYLAYVDRYTTSGADPIDDPTRFSGTALQNNPADNTDIFLITSDDGGATWSAPSQVNDDSSQQDGFSQSLDSRNFIAGRPQFQPSVAVDQTTGTLVVSFLDARYDAARSRVATELATSIDGGATFAPQTYANASMAPTDAITGSASVLGPVPENQSPGNPLTENKFFAFGESQGLAVSAGHIYPIWAGNENDGVKNISLLGITVAPTVTATGPRIVGSTMGPVTGETATDLTTGTTIHFNNRTAPDGTPVLDGFIVTFDRPVSPASFTAADVAVYYRDPNTSGSSPGVYVPLAAAPVPIVDPTSEFTTAQQKRIGATAFFIRTTDQTGTGTYSYAVGPGIADRIRTVNGQGVTVPGNTMDQNADATTGEDPRTSPFTGMSPGDLYEAPNPSPPSPATFAGADPMAPFDPKTLPLLVYGPHIVSTSVPGSPASADNLVTDRTVNALDVTFDRDMQVSTFTAGDVTRIAGPSGTIGGTSVYSSQDILKSIPAGGTLDSTLTIGGAGFLVSDLKVRLDISIPRDSDLTATLVGADGTRVTLFAGVGGGGANFSATTLDDLAAQSIAQGTAPFSGSFRPVQSLDAAFANKVLQGSFTLELVNSSGVDVGTLNSWSLAITPAVTVTPAYNSINANVAITGGNTTTSTVVVPDDGGAFTINNLRVRLDISMPSDADITAVLIGPDGKTKVTLFSGAGGTGANFTNTVFDDQATTPIGQGLAPFTGSFQPAQSLGASFGGLALRGTWTLQITDNNAAGKAGALNSWSLEATPSNPTTSVVARTFRIGFPAQQLGGTYTVSIAPTVQARNGDMVDADLDAGLDALRNTPSAGTTPLSYSSAGPTAITANSTVNSTITVPASFSVQVGTTVLVDINFPTDPDLSATLIAPNGTAIPLFQNVGASVGSQTGFSGTIFDDNASTPIQDGGPPFTGPYNPQKPLAGLKGINSQGPWTLQIQNGGGNTGTLTDWTLTLIKPLSQTGLGGSVADLSSASFRIFTMSQTNSLSSSVWTAAGPAGIDPKAGTLNGETAGAVTAIAVDPSDPSGNTVYIGAATGGVWKTTDFLTTSPNGPTYIPLTDFGPTFSLNIGSIAVFPRNNDPNQTVIIAGTGEGSALGDPSQAAAARGVGFLVSMDGGATWTLSDGPGHAFALGGGTTTFKVAIDPTAQPNGNLIVYAAIASLDPNSTVGGVWRSDDSGLSWQQMRVGAATDVVLDLASGTGGLGVGNAQIIYAAFEGDGVYFSPNRGQNWELMGGTVGDPLIQNQGPTPQPVPVSNLPSPNGANGRIVLAKPALTGNPLEDLLYSHWLYAAVATTNTGSTYAFGSHLAGLYLTKDDGQTWTQVRIPSTGPVVPTNDVTNPDYTIAGNKTPAGSDFGKANYDLTLAVDPTNPNIVYLGGTNQFQGSGLVRVDTTGLADAHAFYLSGVESGAGTTQNTATGAVTLINPAALPSPLAKPYQANHAVGYGFLNMLVDPSAPFLVNTTILVTNIGSFTNNGANASWTPFDQALKPATFEPLNPLSPDWWAVPTRDVQQIVTMTDPLTGQSRLIIGDGQGVYTAVAADDGTLIGSVGDTPGGQATTTGDVTVPSGSRNGNLQIAQMFGGAAQSSYLAAQIAQLQGMFYGSTFGTGVTASNPNVVNAGQAGYGNISGSVTLAPDGSANEGRGTAVGIATQQNFTLANGQPTIQGDSNLYTFQVPESLNDQQTPTSDFFQVDNISRTQGLLQASNGGDVADPLDWPYTQGYNFAVNPLNGNQVLISSKSGRIFRTETQGKSWSIIGDPATFGTSLSTALAFGAPDPSGPNGVGNLDDYLLTGTQSGQVYITQTGGGGGGNNAWENVAPANDLDPIHQQPDYNGLDGSPILAIDPSPTRGSHAAYVVTQGGTVGAYGPDPKQNTVVPANGTLTQTITVPRDLFTKTLTVTVNLTTPDDHFISMALVAPDGETFPLVNAGDVPETNPPQANFTNTTFDDQAGQTLKQAAQNFTAFAPFQGTFALATNANNPTYLSDRYNLAKDFYGKDMKGAWKLVVTNGGAQGQLTGWALNYSTLGGVYYNPDTTKGPPQGQIVAWTGLAGNADIFRNQAAFFGNPALTDATAFGLTTMAVDWRYVVPNDFSNPSAGTHPVLYVGANNGVYRSLDGGLTFASFPSTVQGDLNTPTPPGGGGGLPDAQVTSLDLALGNIDPNTGMPRALITASNPAQDIVSPNVLLATTYGRGQFAIHLAPTVFSTSLGLDPNLPNPPGPGAGGSDSGNSSAANNPGGAAPDDQHDRDTNVADPFIDGYSLPSAFGNVITINLYDMANPLVPVLIGTGQTDAKGHFAVQINPGYFKTDGSTDGLKTIGVQAVDQTGAPGNVASFLFTLDTTPPAAWAAGALVLDSKSDSGISNTDDITNVTSPVFDVAGVEKGAELLLYRDGTVVKTLYDVADGTTAVQYNPNGTVSIQDPGPVSDGIHSYRVQQYDVAANQGPLSSPLLVTIDTQPAPTPTQPVLEAKDDSGISNSDGVTSVNTNLHFDIGGIESTENGTVELLRNGVVVAALNYVKTPGVTLVDPGPVPDGTYTYTAIQIDLAGNPSAPSASETVTIDTQLPPTPNAPVLEAKDDTSGGKDVTSRNTNLHFDIGGIEIPNLNGTVELLRKLASDPVTAYVVVASMNYATTATVTLADPGPVPDGTYTYAAEQIDLAGNASALSPATTVTIDTSTPPPPGAPVLAAADDSGTFNNDDYTKVTNPHFTVAPALTTATVELLRKPAASPASAYAVVASRVGAGVLQDPGPVQPDGLYDYVALQINLAGTPSGLSPDLPVTIDTTPPAAPGAPVLDPNSDSGVKGDDITNIINPFFDVPGIEANANLELFRNGTLVNTLVDVPTGGTVTIQDPGPVQPDGVYTYTAIQVDLAANTGPTSVGTAVTINTTPPGAPNVPVLELVDDTSGGKDITSKDQTLHFDISGVIAGATVQLLRKLAAAPANTFSVVGTGVVGTGATTITIIDPGVVPDGQYDYAARQVDVAGNIGPRSGSLPVTIDTVAPVAPNVPVLDPASDTGISNHDDITRITLFHFPIFDLSGIEPTATVHLERKLDGQPASSYTVVASRVGPGQLSDPQPASDGLYDYAAYQVDQAGNVGPVSGPLVVIYDTTAPVAPTAPVLDPNSDSGVKGDDITNVTNPTFDFTNIEPNATVELLRDGTVVATVNYATVGAGGAFSIKDPGPVSNGAHSYHAFQVDLAGNTSPLGGVLTITVITGTPPAPAVPVLDPNSDSGVKGDDITNVTSPTIDVSGVIKGGTVELFRNGKIVASTTSAAGGTVQIKDPGPDKPDGVYVYTAEQVDVAGNTSAPSGPLSVTVLTSAPAPTGLTLDPNSDSGVKGDDITNVTSPTIDVAAAAAGSTVTLFRDGKSVATRTGPGPVQDPGPVPDGAHTYTAQQIDVAGNTSPMSTGLNVTILTKAPATPGALTLDPNSDSSHGQDITNVTNPVIDVKSGTAGDTLELYRNGALVATETVPVTQPFTIQDPGPALAGQTTYTADQVDVAGNTSPLGAPLAITIVTAAPPAPSTLALDPASTTGAPGSNITSVTAPIIDVGGIVAGNTVLLYRDGLTTAIATVVSAKGGTVQVQDPGLLKSGTHVYVAEQQDTAGNTSAPSSTLTITVDTTTPGTPTQPYLTASSTTGITDVTSKNGNLAFAVGNLTVGDNLELLRKPTGSPASSFVVVSTTKVNATSTQVTDPTTNLADGQYDYAVVQLTLAGGASATSAITTVTIDTQTPVAPLPVLTNGIGSASPAFTTSRSPQLAGTTEANAEVLLLDASGNTLGATEASASGSFVVSPSGALADGQYTVHFQVINLANTYSQPGPALTLTVTTSAVSYDGSGKASLALFRPQPGPPQFLLLQAAAGPAAHIYGEPGDIPVQGDFDGDGRTDLAVYRPSNATWYILESTGGFETVQFGQPNVDVPVPGNYDGPGKTEIAVFRPTTGQWLIMGASGNRLVQWGGPGDIPVPADYEGTGTTDLAVFTPSTATWYLQRPTLGSTAIQFGAANLDVPVPADYDGDHKADVAIFRPTTGEWFINQTTAGPRYQQFGQAGDIPVPADYDGDGKADVGIYRPSLGVWAISESTAGPKIVSFGASTDIPVIAPYRYRAPAFSSTGGGGIAGGAAGAAVVGNSAAPNLGQQAQALALAPAASTTKTKHPHRGRRTPRPVHHHHLGTRDKAVPAATVAQALDELGPIRGKGFLG
jgi:subtilisin-like proprotein convertase family protein